MGPPGTRSISVGLGVNEEIFYPQNLSIVGVGWGAFFLEKIDTVTVSSVLTDVIVLYVSTPGGVEVSESCLEDPDLSPLSPLGSVKVR